MLKVAVFVDAEFMSANKYACSILEKAHSCGKVAECGAYGKEKHLKRWRKIEKFKCVTVPKGKNKADEKIRDEALEMIDEIDIFIIVVNDTHYVKLRQDLRQLKKRVIVMGTNEAANSLKKDCEFVKLKQAKTTSTKSKKIKKAPSAQLKSPAPTVSSG